MYIVCVYIIYIYIYIYICLYVYTIYIYIYMTNVNKPCTSCLYCVNIDMFEGVSLFPVFRKNPARKAASKTFAHACRAVTY